MLKDENRNFVGHSRPGEKKNSHVYTRVQIHKHECLLTGMDSKENKLRGKAGRVPELDEERN